MNIEGSTALVTGTNRGLGNAFVQALLNAGAGKVYAAARIPGGITDARLTPVTLDVSSQADIAAAALGCGDVDILINNAGAMLSRPALAPDAHVALRHEMEVNGSSSAWPIGGEGHDDPQERDRTTRRGRPRPGGLMAVAAARTCAGGSDGSSILKMWNT